MKKILLQLFSLVISAFAGAMMAQAQSTYEPYHFGLLGGLADNPNSARGARVTERIVTVGVRGRLGTALVRE